MADILRFIRSDTAFDAEATSALVAAYEQAIGRLHDSGQPELVPGSDREKNHRAGDEGQARSESQRRQIFTVFGENAP